MRSSEPGSQSLGADHTKTFHWHWCNTREQSHQGTYFNDHLTLVAVCGRVATIRGFSHGKQGQ